MFGLQDVTLKYTEATSSTYQHVNDAASDIHTSVVAPQVPKVETESVVTSEVGSGAKKSFVSEPVASGMEASDGAEKPAAQENCGSSSKLLENSGLESSSEPVQTAVQEKNQLEEEGNHVGRTVNRLTKLDPTVKHSTGESPHQIGLQGVAEEANITAQMDGCLRESSVEKVGL
jgi:hypothetical protein